ncbi:dynein light intermediate chain-domain-containing protein [Dipodascopsis uninucleata]
MDTWSSLLESASKNKPICACTLVLLGGSLELQNEFIHQISRSVESHSLTVDGPGPCKTDSGIGYTYLAVSDSDQDELLLKIHIYTIVHVYTAYGKLLTDVLNRQDVNIENVSVVVLLDWGNPRRWIRDFAFCLRFLKHTVLPGVDAEKLEAGLASSLQQYKRRMIMPFTGSDQLVSVSKDEIAVSFEEGEYDIPLGIELLVVAMHPEKIDILERQYGRKDDEFDFIQQFLRTILLKHGASLLYLSERSNNLFPMLLYLASCVTKLSAAQSKNHLLNIAYSVKPNVVDRDSILTPSGWDSWSKIKMIRESFDIAGVSKEWVNDLSDGSAEDMTGGLTEVYEDVVQAFGNISNELSDSPLELEVETIDSQEFLKQQQINLDKLQTSWKLSSTAAMTLSV